MMMADGSAVPETHVVNELSDDPRMDDARAIAIAASKFDGTALNEQRKETEQSADATETYGPSGGAVTYPLGATLLST